MNFGIIWIKQIINPTGETREKYMKHMSTLQKTEKKKLLKYHAEIYISAEKNIEVWNNLSDAYRLPACLSAPGPGRASPGQSQ